MSLATASNLDRSPTTLANALREIVKGEVYSDPFTRSLYATDASIYEIEPILVVNPLDELDVRSCLWFGQKHGVAVIARGGGSGLAGESLGKAIIMDLSVHMNRVLELDIKRGRVTVQTGIVLDSLNRALASHGFKFGPDPASSNRCTIGGMIANNSSGAHSLRYGDTRANVIGARVCLMDGTVTLAHPLKLNSEEFEEKKKEEGFSGKVHRELPDLIKKNAALIASKKPKTERNRSGYLLHDVVQGAAPAEMFDLTRLICGSEGTLGVVTQAVLKVEPAAARSGMAFVYFANVIDAAKAVPAIRATQPTACELFDERLLALSRQYAAQLQAIVPEDAKSMLVVEYEGDDEAALTAQLDGLKTKLPAGSYTSIYMVPDASSQAALWAARAAAAPALYRRTDGLQPVPVVEDGAVPIDKLALYLEKAGKVFEKYKLEWNAYAHAGSGLVHIRPMMDLRKKEHFDILEKMAGEIHAIVWECGGTISGEHAEGLVRSQWIEKQAGKELLAVYKEVKALFDPSNLLNPDKKISSDAHLMLKNLRFGPAYHFSTGEKPRPASIDPTQAANFRMFKSQTSVRTEMTVEALAANPLEVHQHGRSPLNWIGAEMAQETERCNGCGHCKTTGPDEDMCPRFKYERIEDASPRAKANILRRLMTGRQKQGTFSSHELIEIMDTCFNCKLCIDGCPAHVNIPKIVLEAKARYHQAHGLSADKWFLTKLETLYDTLGGLSPITNTAFSIPIVRVGMEKLLGIDRRRPIPDLRRWKFQRRYLSSAASDRQRVVLYMDLYGKYNAPEIGQAAIDVLEHNGYQVELPDVPWCNMPALSNGAVVESRSNIAKIAKVLAPFAFQGIPIVTQEPSACLALQQDFLYYVDTPETRAISRHTQELGAFLMGLLRQQKLKTDFQTIKTTLGYHQPCHHKALHVGVPMMELAAKVPGVKVLRMDHGCCGNPGGWGMAKKNYDESMAIGQGLFNDVCQPKNGIDFALTESSDCRCQIEHGAAKPVLHPIQVLAAAYGYAAAEPIDDGLDKPEPQPAITHREETHAPQSATEGHGEEHADHAHGHAETHSHEHATSH